MPNISRPFWPITAFALSLGLAGLSPAAAAPSYDGAWSVRITAESGECSTRMSLPIKVARGRVSYSGPFNAKAAGVVGANGRLSVSFSHQDDVVTAKGSLKGASGHGSWKSPTKRCGGTWTAHKA